MSESIEVLHARLLRGIQALKIELPADAVEKLLAYLQLLTKWNRAYNLTAVRDIEQMVSRHLLDSLSVLPFLQNDKKDAATYFADVGTGAGLPGLVLAIVRPDYQFDLLDSNGKKIRFVTQAIAELRLNNARAHCVRVEEFKPVQKCNAVLSRAFTSLSEFVRLCEHLLAEDGRLLAMKGNYPAEEIAVLPAHWQVQAVHTLAVPEEKGQRHLLILNRRDSHSC